MKPSIKLMAIELPLIPIVYFAQIAISLMFIESAIDKLSHSGLALSLYSVSVNFYYFDFWNEEGVESLIATKEFLKNIAVSEASLSMLILMVSRKP